MSRIGKKIIEIPQGVDVMIEGQTTTVKGPKGALTFLVPPEIIVSIEGNQVTVSPKADKESISKHTKSLWGTVRQIMMNMIKGVTSGYEIKLEIEGVGYRSNIEGDSLVLYIGFTNPVKLKIPEGIKATVEKNIIVLVGFEKQAIGQFAASIRGVRPVEPYKGKGIKYQGEQVRKKLGKKAAATTGGAGAK